MRNGLILSILVVICLSAPALAGEHYGERRNKSIQTRLERVEQGQPNHGMHDRRSEKYGQFQHRLQRLSKELCHARRENRRLEDRDARRESRKVRRHAHRRHYAAAARAPRRLVLPPIFPSIVVRIPLNW